MKKRGKVLWLLSTCLCGLKTNPCRSVPVEAVKNTQKLTMFPKTIIMLERFMRLHFEDYISA